MNDHQNFIIYYYYGEYRVGITKVYHTITEAYNEDAARTGFYLNYPGAKIKNIQ